MSRFIDADKIPWTDINDNQNSNIKVLVTFAEKVNRMPTADVRENVRGEWIMDTLETTSGSSIHEWRCNKCNVGQLVKSNFCPSCGADMRGDNNGKRNDS